MKTIIPTISLIALCAVNLHAQTLFEATIDEDILYPDNWSNSTPAPGNDGMIAIDGTVTGETITGFGNVTLISGATLTRDGRLNLYDTSFFIEDGSLTTLTGGGNGNLVLGSNALPSTLTMTTGSTLNTGGNLVVFPGSTLTLTDGAITVAGKFNNDGVANLVGGTIIMDDLFEGGNGGVFNLTDTQITIPAPLEDIVTLTVFRTNDPWTFNFISGGTGQIRIVGLDEVDDISALITDGTVFTIDGVVDNNLSSYSLTYDGSDTLFSLSTGSPSPLKITATSFDSVTRTFSLTWESDDSSSYTISESPDLLPGNWSVVDAAVAGLAGSTTYDLIGLPIGQTERFYRVEKNP